MDRRFGENDATMTPEERMLERFTKERQRASKGAVFNLEDEDDLTHYGRSLSVLDDFDATGLDADQDSESDGELALIRIGELVFITEGDTQAKLIKARFPKCILEALEMGTVMTRKMK